MRITVLLLLAALMPLPALAASGTARSQPDAAHYRQCLNTSSGNPAAALADAEAWTKAGGGVPAQHCAALSLINLKRYAEAGTRLDRLAADKGVPSSAFRAALFDQAGNAWLLAGDGAHAVQSLSAAITLSANDADLFADLGRAQAMVKNWHEVDLDLNAALQIAPRRADFLVLRASARRALKRYDDSRTDIEAALKLKPGDANALVERGLLKREMGDLGGAKKDFQTALHAAPAGETAVQARENLEALNP